MRANQTERTVMPALTLPPYQQKTCQHTKNPTQKTTIVLKVLQNPEIQNIFFWKDWMFWTPTAISVMMQLYVCSVLIPFLSPKITPGNSTHVPCTPELSLPSCVNWLKGYQYLYIP